MIWYSNNNQAFIPLSRVDYIHPSTLLDSIPYYILIYGLKSYTVPSEMIKTYCFDKSPKLNTT